MLNVKEFCMVRIVKSLKYSRCTETMGGGSWKLNKSLLVISEGRTPKK